jgi:lipopolysaccharide transport system permease protein
MGAGDDNFDLIIEPTRGFQHYWRDLWRYRELFFFMAWRDILVRYKQTVLGLAWSVLRPFLILVVFTVLFGQLARFPSEGDAPYAIMVLAALLPWQLFANVLAESSNSLILNAGMVSKVYFPRIIIPTSTVIVGCVDFLVAFGLMAGVMVWYQYLPGVRALALPVFVVLAVLTALGGGLWMSALNVKYRDFRYIVPFMVQFGLYVSPVGFSSSVVPENWRLLYSLNPMVGVIDGFRWAILGGDVSLYWPGFLLSIGVAALFFWSGLAYFRNAERSFADVI